MLPSDLGQIPGIVALIIGLVTGYFTWQSQRDRNRIDKSVSAIEGFDKLAEDQRTDLIACKKELKETHEEVNVAQKLIHEHEATIAAQAREIVELRHRVEQLEART